MPEYHQPVLLSETLALLDPREGGVFVDATLGGAGHAVEIARAIGRDGVLVGIDRDPEAIEFARNRLAGFDCRKVIVRANFADIRAVIESAGISEIDGVLFDFGVSSHQLDSERGFTFQRDEPLDMRMSALEPDTPSAADIVNRYSESDLADLIWKYGEERYSRRIARAIVERRSKAPITRTCELEEAIWSAVPVSYRHGQIHPSTRSFQAIRCVVNRELESIEAALPEAVGALKPGGRMCAISFHSLEDRIVKQFFRRMSGRCECPPRMPICECGAEEVMRIITRKPIVPGPEEIEANARSRSARLRCAQKLSRAGQT